MRLGVDLGTTWTAAAIHTAEGCEAVQLAEHTIAMPTVVASVNGELVVGDAAERHLATEPAAGAREFKRRLGDSTPYVLAGAPFGAEALMGHVLRHVIVAAEAQAGQRPDSVTLTHPANWGEFKLDLLREAGRVAGVDEIELMSEPEAAARHYARLGRLEPGQAVAVFDFGGGTFDAAVVRNGEDGPELLGTPEGLERLGGIDVDHAVLAHVDAALDGQLRELDGADPAVRAGLARLRAECTAAKEALSSDTETSVHVALPGLNTEIRVSRGELEQVLRQRMDDMLGALGRAVSSSGLQMADLSGVLLVGGSSRMPAVAELVSAATGLPTLIDADPKLVVAAGAAWPRGAVDATVASEGQGLEEGGSSARPAAAGGAAGAARSAAAAQRSERLRRAVSLVGATAAAGAVAVGGYFAYKQWWDGGTAEAAGPEDGEMSDAEAELFATGLAEELFSELAAEPGPESLDAFEMPVGVPGAAGPSLGGPSFGGPSFGGASSPGPRMHSAPSRPAPRPHHDAPDMPRPRPRVEHEPSGNGEHSGPSATTRPADLFSDPELESVRMQLRERIVKLSLPDGTDPADATKLRTDLEGLLERFRAYPGQSVDDAVSSLRYEFEDRVRDFAQDQRIDALIEEQNKPDMPTDKPAEMPAETPGEMPADKPAETPVGAACARGAGGRLRRDATACDAGEHRHRAAAPPGRDFDADARMIHRRRRPPSRRKCRPHRTRRPQQTRRRRPNLPWRRLRRQPTRRLPAADAATAMDDDVLGAGAVAEAVTAPAASDQPAADATASEPAPEGDSMPDDALGIVATAPETSASDVPDSWSDSGDDMHDDPVTIPDVSDDHSSSDDDVYSIEVEPVDMSDPLGV